MAQELLSIGKVSALYGVSVQTLRHYEKIGLFMPDNVNQETGYRYYTVRQLPRLEFILFFKRLQLSLPQIGEILSGLTWGDLQESAVFESLEKERARLDGRIAELQNLRRILDEYFEMRQRPPARLEEIHIKEFPPRRFTALEVQLPERSAPEFAAEQLYARRQLFGNSGPVAVDQSFCAVASLSAFQSSGQIRYLRLMLEPNRYAPPAPGPESGQTATCDVPDGSYLTVRFRRGQTRTEDMYRLLLDFAAAHRFAYSEEMLEVEMDPLFSGIARQADLIELQMRITL